MSRILQNIKVLDLTRVIAGPLCTQNLADLGATVYKIEKPGEGDDTRRMGPFLKDPESGVDSNDSALYLAYNRGKKSIGLDIATPGGMSAIQALVAKCDVFVENFKAGNLKKYGLDYESVRQIRPDIIYCSITGFGQSGPLAEQPAYDFILQGMAGVMSTCGLPDGVPGGGSMRTAIPIVDMATGQNATISILAALYQRQVTGEGQHIDCAMLDSAVAMNGHLAVGYFMTGKNPPRVGNTNPIASPSEVFECQDGQLIIAVGNNLQFRQFCNAIGLPDLPNQPEFAANAMRVKHRTQLREVIAPVIEKLMRGELIEKFAEYGVPSGPLNDISEVFESPQTTHRQLRVEMQHKTGQPISVLKSPLGIVELERDTIPPPMLGGDTAEVLCLELGMTERDLHSLLQSETQKSSQTKESI